MNNNSSRFTQVIIFLFSFIQVIFSIDRGQLTQLQIKAIQDQINKHGVPGAASKKGNISQIKTEFGDSLFSKSYSRDSLKEVSASIELNHFGYDYFELKTNRAIWNNQPPHADYVLGPGDEIIIEIWGDTQLRSTHVIDRYGKINIDKIGQVHFAGIILDEVESKLLSKFQHVYSSLKAEQATAVLDVSIGKLKSINVTFLGEVLVPGINPIHPFSTIITGIMQAGGIHKNGSLRNIQLIRNGKLHNTLDFYQYLLNAKAWDDLRLLDGDIIFIPVRHSSVSIKGEIIRNAIFELVENETLEDLIQYSGGLTIKARQDLRIHRYKKQEELTPFSSIDETFFINYIHNKDFIIQDGDEVMVYKYSSSNHDVFVYGQVKNPGKYSFNTNQEMNLLDVLLMAGGLNDTTFIKTIYQETGEIIRSHPQKDYPDILEFNIGKLIAGDPEENKLLQNWDIILIRQNPYFQTPRKVWVKGEVKVPGIYTLQKKGETLGDVLTRSGGFTAKAFKNGIRMFRDKQQVVSQNFDIILLDGDSLFIPENPGVVQVLGEVYKPGLIQYDKKKSLRAYIENAGGFNLIADKTNIIVVYANGYVKVKKRYNRLTIGEGSTIIIQAEEESEPFDITEFASNFTTIVTSFATVYLLFNQ